MEDAHDHHIGIIHHEIDEVAALAEPRQSEFGSSRLTALLRVEQSVGLGPQAARVQLGLVVTPLDDRIGPDIEEIIDRGL